jgi:hypothetical protein
MAQLSVKHARIAIAKVTKRLKKPTNRISTKHLYLAGALLLLALLTFGAVVLALNNALYFEGPAQDGAFQLLNPLRRLMDGQIIGRDFNFFHGVGVPFLHLPLYAIFGQGLFAEEVSRWLMSPLLFIVSIFAVFYVWRRRFVLALGMSVAITTVGLFIVPSLVLPITSILGVRSVMPVFLLAVILNQKRLDRPVVKKQSKGLFALTRYELSVGALLAASLLCGTEFGAAAILAYVIARIVYPIQKGEVRSSRWISLLRTGVSAGLVALVALAVITHGNPLEPLRYALVDIPADQFWYFGVPPNTYIHSGNVWHTFATDWPLLIMWAVALVALLLGRRVYKLDAFRGEIHAFVYAWLAGAFAMVSMLGYYNNSEASALARMGLIVGAMSLVIVGERWKRASTWGFEFGKLKKRFKLRPETFWRGLAIVFIVAVIGFGVFLAGFMKQKFVIGEAFTRAKDYITGVDTNVLGGEWKMVDQMVIPVIQADNTVSIADVSEGGFSHGVKLNQLIVASSQHDSFIRSGQIVYFTKSGRQIIRSVEKKGDKLYVTLQSDVQLKPDQDGAPEKLIVAEDFKHDNTKVWSFYTGILNQEMGIMNPSRGGYDYIIHALGQQRRDDYMQDFKNAKPQFVMTFTQRYFAWESWMENEHWDLYSLIDQNYEVVQQTPTYAVWKRKDQAWTEQHKQSQDWQSLKIEGEDKIDLPKLSFDNVPDLDTYTQQLNADQRQHMLDLGFVMDNRRRLNLEQYDQATIEKFDREVQIDRLSRENNGPEADAAQKKTDQEQYAKVDADIKTKGYGAPEDVLLHPRPKRAVVLVKLHYKLSSSISAVPIFGKTVRFMVEANNVYSTTAISLKPYANEMTFPVVVSELNDAPYLRLKAYSLLPAEGVIDVTSAEWTLLDTLDENLKVFTD